jgi:CHAT domain-containing protein
LARPADQHLSQDELEFLVSSGTSRSPGVDAQGVSSHCAECGKCRLLAESYATAEARLVSIKLGDPTPRGFDCPPDEEWLSVAAGLVPTEQAERDMQHASNCDRCGPLLRSAVEDFTDELTPDEESLVNGLNSSNSKWQKGLAKRLSVANQIPTQTTNASVSWWGIFSRRPRLVLSVVSLVLFAVFAGLWLNWTQPQKRAEELLAAAYTHQRTMELRIPGADYAPLRIERGSSRSRLQSTPDLLEAEAIIARNLQRHATDPVWLQAKARADLLEGNYGTAIETLERVRDVQPNSPAVMTDLATAYFQRGEAEDRAGDYGIAVDLLSRALAIKPDSSIALFNRAIASERLFLYKQALDDWERYLQIDPHGIWSGEAKQRLRNLNEQLDKHIKGANSSLLDPRRFNETVSAGDSATWDEIDSRIEAYLQTATVEWLPKSSASESNGGSEQARRALSTLAGILQVRHQDTWLRSQLAEPRGIESIAGIDALAVAVQADANGDFSLGLAKARDAQSHFAASHGSSGGDRAALEEIYALHLSDQADKCLAKIAELSPDVANRSFSWLQTQLLVEESICMNMKGNIGQAKDVAFKAWKAGQIAAYPSLILRAEGMSALLSREAGDIDSAWNLCRDGLVSFWGGTGAEMTGYNFYSYMDLMSEQQGELLLNVEIDQQALSLIASSSDLLLRGEEHNRLARSAERAGLFELAEVEFSVSSSLFSSAKDARVAENYRLGAQIGMARMESRLGKNQSALSRINGLRGAVLEVSNRYLTSDYFQTYGEVLANTGHLRDAEEELRNAVNLSERELETLHSERTRTDWALQTKNLYQDLVEVLLDQGKDLAALEMLEFYRAVPLRSTIKRIPVPKKLDNNIDRAKLRKASSFGPDRIGTALAAFPESTLIVYASLPHGIAIWLPKAEGTLVKRVKISPDSFRQFADRFDSLCASPNSSLDAVDVMARQGYALLISPIAGYLQEHRTLVIDATDRAFNQIPFQALMDSKGRYIVEEYAIVHSPGLLYLTRLKQDSDFRMNARPLIVANSSPGPDARGELRPLIDANEEAKEVSHQIPASRLLIGREATLAAVKHELPNATLFHFAGHAELKGESVGLLMNSTDPNAANLLDSSVLEGLNLLKLQLAVLSACGTENGTHGSPEDWESLTLGFIRAGVPHVIASRWSVDSNYSRIVMHSFYAQLLAGRDVGNALSVAESQVLHRPGAEHPYYWAAFDAFGKN